MKQKSDRLMTIGILCACGLLAIGIVWYNLADSPDFLNAQPELREDYVLTSQTSESGSLSSRVQEGESQQKGPSSSKISSAKTSSRKTSSKASSSKPSANASSHTAAGEASRGPVERQNINTATFEQLIAVDGIGETTANRILEFREKCGGFDNMDQLMNVKGVGYQRKQALEEYFYAIPPVRPTDENGNVIVPKK